jgi:hypothetical protein
MIILNLVVIVCSGFATILYALSGNGSAAVWSFCAMMWCIFATLSEYA